MPTRRDHPCPGRGLRTRCVPHQSHVPHARHALPQRATTNTLRRRVTSTRPPHQSSPPSPAITSVQCGRVGSHQAEFHNPVHAQIVILVLKESTMALG